MEPSMLPRDVRVIYRQVARPRLELKPWGLLIVLPHGYDEKYAYQLIKKHEKWVKSKYTVLSKAIQMARNLKTVDRPIKEFKLIVRNLIEEYSKELGVKVNRIYVRNMTTKWASCSSKGNITVNNIARFLPEELLKYILYHEVCHLVEKKHNERFWNLVANKFPNYKELELRLLAYQIKLINQV